MTLTPEEAAARLGDVQHVMKQSAKAFGHRVAAPHLILWGVIWVLGYSGAALLPQITGWIWFTLCMSGGLTSGWLSSRQQRQPPLQRGVAKAIQGAAGRRVTLGRTVVMTVGLTLFCAVLFFILGPVAIKPAIVMPALIVGMVYFCVGLFWLPRLSITGVMIFALTVIGYLWLPLPELLFYMAFVGGGGLIVSGLWMRSA